MRLRKLRLQNFRQHVDSRFEFQPGLTGIIGPNGAGKSTVLEAIAWAIYGASAVRGTNDTIRFARAPGRARVLVELTFELGGHDFHVSRTMSSADVTLDNGITPVATGTSGVTTYLEQRIGMTREEFFNTYFTSQKELQFLARMGPKDRARFLAQVLGYERLRYAQDKARERRKELSAEANGLREALPDPADLSARKSESEQRVKSAKAALTQAEQHSEESAAALAQLEPRWLDVQQQRERTREVQQEIEAATRDGEAARRDIERAQSELDRIAQAAQELEPLRARLRELPGAAREVERHVLLARVAERRRVLEDHERDTADELTRTLARLEQLKDSPDVLKQAGQELARLNERLSTADANVTRLRNEWAAERQDVRTKLQQHLERHDELKYQIEQLRATGPDGTCPICTRPLGQEFERVVGLLEEQFEEVMQNGKWLRKREAQLEKMPADLKAAEQEHATVKGESATLTERVTRTEQALREAATLGKEQTRRQERLAELRAELAKLPGGYDATLHEKAEADLKALRAVEQQTARLEQILERRSERVAEHKEASARAQAVLVRLQAAAVLQAKIAFDPNQYEQLRSQFEAGTRTLHQTELALTEARARHDSAREHQARIKEEVKTAEQNRARLQELELDVKHHVELDQALQQLRQELNARVRPELSDLASTFLSDVTDGRYNGIEIDENYNVIVLDEGEEKPVISGGEEDIANLVLRVAISQMIAERAGQQLSVLFLDEVFGSLDLEHRDSVVQMLHRLENRFEQVILITHVETIREGLDHTIRVTYDERTGASVVTEETAGVGELVLV
jgi:DNA repair protein SbcC/Rad50